MLNVLAFVALYSSRVGRAWRSIRVNAQLAETLGINLHWYRLLAFIISSASAGLAGSFYAHYFQALEPGMFTAFKSINVQIFAILGGLNYYIVGPAVGAAIMTFVPELLRVGREIEPVITGAALILLKVIFLPGGVLSLRERLGSFSWRLANRAGSDAKCRRSRGYTRVTESVGSLLEVRNVSKYFGGLAAVSDVSFDVSEGGDRGSHRTQRGRQEHHVQSDKRFFASGSGKITYAGREITGLKAHVVARLGIGRAFQAPTLFMNLSVFENVFNGFHLRYQKSSWKSFFHTKGALEEEKQARSSVTDILELMGLARTKHVQARNLPHGHQKVLGASALPWQSSPSSLLLDEPLSGMHPEEAATMGEIINNIRSSGVTIILVEHNVGAVMRLCNRIVVLTQGRKIAEGAPKEIAENQEVIEAYLGTDDEEEID